MANALVVNNSEKDQQLANAGSSLLGFALPLVYSWHVHATHSVHVSSVAIPYLLFPPQVSTHRGVMDQVSDYNFYMDH